MKTIPYLVLIQICIYIISILPFITSIKWRCNKLYIRTSENYKNCIICLGILFCIIASYDGDWYHYYKIIITDDTNIYNLESLESIHKFILKHFTFGNYLWWRFIIWGGTYYFYYLSLNRIDQNNLITWSCFTCMTMLQISTGRVYLGISILFYGFCCTIKPRYKYLSFIKGMLFMIIALFFHKSIFIYLSAALFAIFYINNYVLLIGLIILPVIIKIFISALSYYLIGLETTNSAMGYIQKETLEQGIGAAIYSNVFKFSIITVLILFFKYTRQYKIIIHKGFLRKVWQYCYNIAFIYIIVYIALTANGIGSTSISNRIFIGLYIPIPILLSRMIQQNYHLNIMISIWSLFLSLGIYRLLYAYYLQRLGTGV